MLAAILELGCKLSHSRKVNPYDNAVAEATYKIIKTKFVNNNRFETEEELVLGFFEYVNWYNNIRISVLDKVV